MAAAEPGDTWDLDEVFVRINGVLHDLWRAMPQHGVVLDILVQEPMECSGGEASSQTTAARANYKPRR